jgi:hypothetical protein
MTMPELRDDGSPEDSLHWHALNYRTAATQYADPAWLELERYVTEYGRQCFAAGMEAAANIAENTLESVSDRSSIYGTESAAAIRAAK